MYHFGEWNGGSHLDHGYRQRGASHAGLEPYSTARVIGLDVKHEGRGFVLSAADIIELAERAEAVGFESVWTNEDIGYDSFSILSAIAQHTNRIGLGTAIVNVYNRSAMQLAMGASTLNELSGGRFTLGLSVGHHPWNDLGHGIPLINPLARLRETIAFLRKAMSGKQFTHDGPVYAGVDTRLTFDPLQPPPPIFVAGERPRILALAGELADGLLINVVSPDYIAETAIPVVRKAAAAAGRDSYALEITGLVTCCVSEDRDTAMAQARAMTVHRLRHSLKMLDTQPNHRHDEIRHIHEAMLRGDREAALAAVSDALALSIVNAGTADEVAAGLGRYFEAGCTRVIAVPYPRSAEATGLVIDALSATVASA